MFFKKFKRDYLSLGRDYGRRFSLLREKAPDLLNLPFAEILRKCEIPEEVYRVYEAGALPPWLPHALALKKNFDVNLNWLLFGIGPMFGEANDFPARLRKKVSRERPEALPGYYLIWQMMKNPQMEDFFILLMNIILCGGLEGLQSSIEKNPEFAAYTRDSAPGPKDANQQ